MFDQTGTHLYIPSPPVMLSAAGSSQSATTKRHLENLTRSSSYVQFEQPPRAPSGRIIHGGSTPQRMPDGPLVLSYEPTSSLEVLALSLEMESKVAKRALENEDIQEKAMASIPGSNLHRGGDGRERQLCSSPRGQLSESERIRVLDNIETSHHFAQCLVAQGPRIQETLSPLGDRNSPRVTLNLTASKEGAPTTQESNDKLHGDDGHSRNSPRQSSSFASATARFHPPSNGGSMPPVGHYTARYTIVERTGRSASLRDSRAGSAGGKMVAEDAKTSKDDAADVANHRGSTSEGVASPLAVGDDGSRDFPSPRYASPRRALGGAPNSARQRARVRLADAPPSKIRPTSAFASVVPQLHFHTLHMKMHTPRMDDEDVEQQQQSRFSSSLTAPRHNDVTLSSTPRVQSASFQTMRGRGGEALHVPSAAPEDVLVYYEEVPFAERKVPGSVEFVLQSQRRSLNKEGQATSVDAVDLRRSDQSISPRVVSVPEFDRGSKRGGSAASSARDKNIPVTVAVDLIPDRRGMFRAVDKHQRVPALAVLGKVVETNSAAGGSSNADTIQDRGEAFADGGVAQPYSRVPKVDFQMHSSHHDALSFATLPEKRLAQGDFPSTGLLDPPRLDSVRPRVVKDVDIRAMTSRNDHSARAARDAEAAANRPVLESPDSPLRYRRVTGNPHIASATSREQRAKGGCLEAPRALDQFYDVSYATARHKVKLVSSFASQATRATARKGNRSVVQTQKSDDFPGPGTYF
jgi:hypothetical protein